MRHLAILAVCAFQFGIAMAQMEHRDLKTTRAIVAAIDSIIARKEAQIVLAARLSNPDTIVLVPDDDHWPDEVRATYTLCFDTLGHLVMFKEVPTSDSGDWYLSANRYFDRNGTTLLCSSRYATTTSECTSVLRSRRSIYYDERFHPLADTTSWSDAWHNPFTPDTNRCRVHVPEISAIPNVSGIPGALQVLKPAAR